MNLIEAHATLNDAKYPKSGTYVFANLEFKMSEEYKNERGVKVGQSVTLLKYEFVSDGTESYINIFTENQTTTTSGSVGLFKSSYTVPLEKDDLGVFKVAGQHPLFGTGVEVSVDLHNTIGGKDDNVKFKLYDFTTSGDQTLIKVSSNAGIYISFAVIQEAAHVPGGTATNLGLDKSGSQMYNLNPYIQKMKLAEREEAEENAEKMLEMKLRGNF